MGQKGLNVAAVCSLAVEARGQGAAERPRGREAKKPAASQMTGTTVAAHTGQGVSTLQAYNSLKGTTTGCQGLQRRTLLSLKVLLHHISCMWFISCLNSPVVVFSAV